MSSKNSLTPLMQQYWQFKRQHPDKLVFFRMGDFFELFHEDAKIVSQQLGLTLTYRNKKNGDFTPMCGIPHQTLGTYVNRLLKNGHKIVIVDQLEEASASKGLLQRGITQILTPALVWDPEQVAQDRPCWLAAYGAGQWAFWDSTTRTGFWVPDWGFEKYEWILQMFPVAEWLLPRSLASQRIPVEPVTFYDAMDDEIPATEAIRHYVAENWPHVEPEGLEFEKRDVQSWVNTNADFYYHLEVFETYRGQESGTLYHTINRARTPMGQRLLRRYLSWPTRDLTEIQGRHQRIRYFLERPAVRDNFLKALSHMGDLERRWARLSPQKVNPVALWQLAKALEQALEALQKLESIGKPDEKLKSWVQKAFCVLVDDPAQVMDKIGFIRPGVDAQRDEAWDWVTRGHERVRALELRWRQELDIPSLKIRYNDVLGYYVEVTHTHRAKVPSWFIRKQSLTQADRYTFQELLDVENQLKQAWDRCYRKEQEILKQLTEEIVNLGPEVSLLSQTLAEMDVAAFCAELMEKENYSLPEFDVTADSIELIQARHPVVERYHQPFVANDAHLAQAQVHLVFGPNMAGKSTYLRMVALNALLAFCGLPVCAAKSRWPLLDGIFSRIGASDRLSRGESTFMLEMRETAEILNQMQAHSLVILDEVGRGTATFDGLSLAQALVEYFRQQKKGYILFATHYHELAALAQTDPGVINHHMGVSVNESEQVHFLYRITEGHMPYSFGIWVARQAHVPQAVWQRAQVLLQHWQTLWERLQKLSEETQNENPNGLTLACGDSSSKNVIPNNTQTQRCPPAWNGWPLEAQESSHSGIQLHRGEKQPLPAGVLWGDVERWLGRLVMQYLKWFDESSTGVDAKRFLLTLKGGFFPQGVQIPEEPMAGVRDPGSQLSFWASNWEQWAPNGKDTGNP